MAFRLVPWHYNFGTNFQRVLSDQKRAGRLWREHPSMYDGTTLAWGKGQSASLSARPPVRPSSVAVVCEGVRLGRADVRKEVGR